MALAKAQFAVIDEAHNADALLAALPAKLKSDPSYTFARIEILRRANKPDKLAEAVKLMLSAPRDPDVIVDGDAWWIERRLIARKLLDAGDAQTAYQICAEHGAQSAEMRIEAEFHAGWIALRFLGDPTLAAPHFVTAAAIAALPASAARAAYWQGRTAQALGDEAAATAAYSQAAEHVTTYYGQLARSKLGLSDLPLRQTRKLATGDGRELAIRVAEFFYALGETDFALPIVADAARHFTDEGQMAALGKVVETGRDARAALILGKLATQRGIPLDDFAFPIFGVPFYQPVANSADRTIVYAIARQESAFAPTATSTAGAKGLMQLMPDTARRAALHAGIALDMAKLNSDAALNARIGAAHLGELFAEEGGSYVLTFAAYNAGGKRVKEWIAAHGDPRRGDVDPVDWIELIPITETRDYVAAHHREHAGLSHALRGSIAPDQRGRPAPSRRRVSASPSGMTRPASRRRWASVTPRRDRRRGGPRESRPSGGDLLRLRPFLRAMTRPFLAGNEHHRGRRDLRQEGGVVPRTARDVDR